MRPRHPAGACVVLLAAALFAGAAPPEAPPKVEGGVGDRIQIKVTADKGKKVGWEAGFDTAADCEVYRLHSDDPDTYVFLVYPKRTGTFYFVCWTVGDEGAKGSKTLIQVGDGGGGTDVEDPLVTRFRAAYKTEADPQKAEQMRGLARVYEAGAAACDDQTLKTWGDLFGSMTAAALDHKVNGKLPAVNAAVAAELKVALPFKTQDAIVFADRAKAKAAFTKVAKALAKAAD